MSDDRPKRAVSSESLSPKHAAAQGLKKRHSAYALTPQPPDIPELPRYQPRFDPPRSKPIIGLRRTSQHTASRQEITPWEFQTAPPSHFAPSTVRSRASLPTGLVEEVTPWELYPAPDIPESPPHKSRSTRSGRPPSSSGSNKSLADLGVGARRKSTGSKGNAGRSPPRAKPAAQPKTSIHQQHSPRAPVSSSILFNDSFNYTPVYSSSTASVHLSASSSMPRSPLTTKLLAVKKTSSTSRLEARLNSAPDQRFSAADRKILEELRRNISAREAQFAAKGRSVSFGRNGVVHGKKHHPYPRREVPYPRNYEREVLDLDVWETAFCHDACGSITWHVFKTPPTRVLDLGCGTGSWILSCAKEWGDCQFVGLDIVPLHPDLRRIGSPDLASRITWVQANFLEKLPFPNEEFDYVHVKRIALGVPEDKWDPLLEEITRIMKPGAAFELIEEDLFFPGKQVNSDSDSESEDEDTTPGTSLNTSSQTIVEDHHSAETQLLVPARTDDNLTPTTVASALPTTPSRPSSPVPIREVVIAETEETDGDGTLRYDESAHQLPSLSSPSTPTATRPSLQVKTSHESWHTGYRPLMPKRSTSALSLPTPKSSISPIANQSKKISESKGPVPNSNTPHVPMPVIPRTHAEDLPHNLPKTSPEPPINPRDHTLLEAIYVRMLESRFINMSPLSLLGNSLGLYFKDLRTHPAIQFTFPPLPPRKYRIFGKVEEHRKLGEPEQVEKKEFTYNEEEVCGCDDDTEVDEKSRFLSMQALLQHESRYVSLDETRPTAFSPSTRVDFTRSTRDMKSAAIRRSSRLPNGQLQLDLKTLNLHLAMRIEEVSACAESMWEWVTEEQRTIANISQEHNRLMATNRSISRPRTSFSSNVSERTIENTPRDKIAYMTRDDFDGLLTNFRFDMHDQYMPGYALRDRFDWAVSLCLPPPDRIAYDSACEKWRNWEMQEREKATAMRSRLPPALARPRAASSSNLSHVSSTVSAPQITRAHSGQSSVSTQSGQSSLSGGSSTLVPPQGERSGDARGGQGHDTSGESLLANTKNGRPCGTSRVCQTPPTKKQSRALKVFVGWKP